jgi:hypothetical protein
MGVPRSASQPSPGLPRKVDPERKGTTQEDPTPCVASFLFLPTCSLLL